MRSAWSSLGALFEQRANWFAALIILGFFFFRSRALALRHVWLDELATFYVARTFSWARICEALSLAVDEQPPTYHLLQIPVLALLGDRPQSLRWLTLLAACLTLAAAFVWLRRSHSAAASLAGVVLLATSKLSYYSLEARPYALLMASTALALACRGLAGRLAWLTVGVSLHYYAFLVPFLLTWTERTWRRRFAYALTLCPLAITIPAMHPLHILEAGDAFAPTLTNLLTALPIMAGLSRYALLLLLVVAAVFWLRKQWTTLEGDLRVCWLLLAMIPLCWLLGELITGMFFYRYALVALLGLAGLAAALIDATPARTPLALVVAVVCLAAAALSPPGYDSWDARPAAALLSRRLEGSGLPVVMGTDPYLDLHYYLDPKYRSSFYRLTPQPFAFTTEYLATLEQQDPWSEMIGKYAGFTPVGLPDWLPRHPSFLVLAAGPDDWIIEACRSRGAGIKSAGPLDRYWLYQVEVAPEHE